MTEESPAWSKAMTMRLGDAVRTIRTERGLSASELSDRTHELGHRVPRNTIANLENGRKEGLPVHELTMLAAALDVPAAHMLCFPDEAGGVDITPTRRKSAGSALYDVAGAAIGETGLEDPRVQLLQTQFEYALSAHQWRWAQKLAAAHAQMSALSLGRDSDPATEGFRATINEAIERGVRCVSANPSPLVFGDYPAFDALVRSRMEQEDA